MKKQFKIRRANPGFIAIDLIEDNETVGGYLLPDQGENTINISEYLRKEECTEYKKGASKE